MSPVFYSNPSKRDVLIRDLISPRRVPSASSRIQASPNTKKFIDSVKATVWWVCLIGVGWSALGTVQGQAFTQIGKTFSNLNALEKDIAEMQQRNTRFSPKPISSTSK
jgi:hypothetical protein